MDKHQLDALIYPFKTTPAAQHMNANEPDNAFSALTGLPALLMPVGLTPKENGPIALEFLGRPWSEPVLIRLASGFEAVAPHRVTPPTTPPLPGEKFVY